MINNKIDSYRLIIPILFVIGFVRCQSFGEPIFSKNINCINPSWSFDSTRTFTIESLDSKKNKLMIGRVIDDETITLIEVVKGKKKEKGKKYKKVREKNAGWIGEEGSESSLIMVTGEDKTDREKTQRVFFTDNLEIPTKDVGNYVDFSMHTHPKIKKENLRGQYKCFTTINNEDLYFMNLSDHDLIFRTVITDNKILPIQGFSSEKDIAITSISSSFDGSKILIVCNDRTFSEIYDLEISLDRNNVISKTIIDKPDQNLHFFAGIRYPDKNLNHYVLMGSSLEMSKQSLCNIFIMKDKEILASFDGYFSDADFSHIKRPIGQWDVKRNRFYYLKNGDTGRGGELYYWDGQAEKKAVTTTLKNIDDFEFSFNSEYLLVTTKTPNAMYIYRAK